MSQNNRRLQLLILIFISLTVWWVYLGGYSNVDQNNDIRQLYAASYQILAFLGGLFGLFISKHWGGWRSIVGRMILAFSIGLLFQVFGQSAYSYYIYYLHINIPYPSIGDIGFFGTIPIYFVGAFLLTQLSGIKSKLTFLGWKLVYGLIPIAVLVAQYFLILRGYEFDWSDKLKVFLDFGYPLGDAVIISAIILGFLLSLKVMGGIMRKPILFLLGAVCVQYIADIYFFWQANHGLYYVGGFADLFYSFSYLSMALALVSIDIAYKHIRES